MVAIIPPLAKSSSSSNQSLYDQSFAVLGPKLWNKVPSTVRAAPKFDAFKISLSNFLDLIPDNPPVTGYSCSCCCCCCCFGARLKAKLLWQTLEISLGRGDDAQVYIVFSKVLLSFKSNQIKSKYNDITSSKIVHQLVLK